MRLQGQVLAAKLRHYPPIYYRNMSTSPTTHTRAATAATPARAGAGSPHGELSVIRRLLPYLWEYRGRVVLALVFLVTAKLANITVPIVMKGIVDGLSPE